MAAVQTIQYLKQTEIDHQRWDRCLDRSGNRLIYGYSFYLDHMAEHWDALVMGDYERVMPLPWKKKLGFSYICQPFLTAQLGLFGNQITAPLLQQFLEAIPSQFRLVECALNHQNLFPLDRYPLYQRTNYVLDLQPSYASIQSAYRENVRRNIRKSIRYGCRLETDIPFSPVLALVTEQDSNTNASGLQRFAKLFEELQPKGRAKTYGVYSAQGLLLSAAVFLFWQQRAYYILVGNHPNGRTLGSSHALIDAFIRDHAGSPLLLDFEGSDLPKLAFFYSSFGAKEEKYSALRWNRLPWYLRWMK